jgi:hypothetical protein
VRGLCMQRQFLRTLPIRGLFFKELLFVLLS